MSDSPTTTGRFVFSSDLPAWVQAIGSVVGIGVAIAIPLALSRRDERRRSLQDAAKARTYALHVMPKAELLHTRLRNIVRLMSDRDAEEWDVDEAHTSLREAIVVEAWGFQLHELGDAGTTLQRSIASASEAVSLLDDWSYYDQWNGSIDNETGEAMEFEKPPAVAPTLLRAEALAEKATIALRALFD
ncbi:TPA: hypothetical protein UOA91_002907 [Stenotrophomonas maltophilia]|nr:hypothetical protein [Stenotrophomonas maltophilia]HEL3778663.1 hypothetical protein [Stenotrophomonas maltophilia]HEL5006668.1 hypothetical protein [Stenotrophomonas maltophilia]